MLRESDDTLQLHISDEHKEFDRSKLKNITSLYLFAVSVFALKGKELAVASLVSLADTQPTAILSGLRTAHKLWPEDEGWTSHSAQALLINETLVKVAAEAIMLREDQAKVDQLD